jgi:phosphoenolpyruvate carboxylase
MAAHPSEVNRRTVKSALLCFGSWIGGDRDGNPNVTSETTVLALRMQAQTILQEYSRRLDELRGQLSYSDGFCELSAAFLKSHQWCIERIRM